MKHEVEISDEAYKIVQAIAIREDLSIEEALERSIRIANPETVKWLERELNVETKTTKEAKNDTSYRDTDDLQVINALNYMIEKFDKGVDPSMKEVADHLELTTRDLGRILRPHGIDTQATSRNSKHMRLYPRKLRNKIELILKGFCRDKL